jgi:hypothetical protein
MFPHLGHPALPENTMAEAERWAAGMRVPAFAIDDETAICEIEDWLKNRPVKNIIVAIALDRTNYWRLIWQKLNSKPR